MLIAKTVVQRDPLVLLQQHMYGTTRTHTNDSLALSYAFGRDDVDTCLDDLIQYTFGWSVRLGDVEKYQFPNVRINVIKHIVSEDETAYFMLMTASLPTWMEYIRTKQTTTLNASIRQQFEKDGYTKRLLAC